MIYIRNKQWRIVKISKLNGLGNCNLLETPYNLVLEI